MTSKLIWVGKSEIHE